MNEIIKMFLEKGILIDRGALDVLCVLKEEDRLKLLDLACFLNVKLLDLNWLKNNTEKIKEKGLENFMGLTGTGNLRVISSTSFLQRKITARDFVDHFRSRFEKIKKIFEEKDFNNLCSVRRVDSGGTIIVAILNKRLTKNKNILLEVEDLSGKGVVVISKNQEELFKKAEGALEDDIVAISVSSIGQGGMIFAKEIHFPDSFLEDVKFSVEDECVAFTGDFHVGSKFFLEKEVRRFIGWLNGTEGGEEEKKIAKKVRYLFLLGDNIDGVGHYPEQERFLDEKSLRGQYKKFEDLLKEIRQDIEIIICPGQHDSVWLGEPQPILDKRWAEGLHEMKNVRLVTNPARVELRGFNILMYHGASINGFINKLPEIRVRHGHRFPARVMEEVLKRRHLSPTYGIMDYIPTKEDSLVIEKVPDIFVIGDQHRAEVRNYNNILMIACSCWQSKTSFDEKMGNIPDPCKVSIFNLRTRSIKLVDFTDGVKMSEASDEA